MFSYFSKEFNDKEFIVSYEVVDGNINIKYKDNKIEIIPYSIKDEKCLLEKMRSQVMSSKVFLGDTKRKCNVFFKVLIDEVVLFIMFLLSSYNMGYSKEMFWLGNIIFGGSLLVTGIKYKKHRDILSEIKKYWLFLDNEDCLNDYIRRNPLIVKGISPKLETKVVNERRGLPFSLNTVNDIGYRDLKKMYNKTSKLVRRREL